MPGVVEEDHRVVREKTILMMKEPKILHPGRTHFEVIDETNRDGVGDGGGVLLQPEKHGLGG